MGEKGHRMNFGKYGRTALLAALVASTSTVVFGGLVPGVAGADTGTIKAKGVVLDNTSTEAHDIGSCFNLDASDANPGGPIGVKFETVSPTSGGGLYSDRISPGELKSIDLSDILMATKTDTTKGWHVKVTVGDKKKTFW